MGKGLAQGPYMAARVGVEPTTLWLKVIDSAKAPPCPTTNAVIVNATAEFTSMLFSWFLYYA